MMCIIRTPSWGTPHPDLDGGTLYWGTPSPHPDLAGGNPILALAQDGLGVPPTPILTWLGGTPRKDMEPVEVLLYYLTNFLQKLHENEGILARRTTMAPPRSANDNPTDILITRYLTDSKTWIGFRDVDGTDQWLDGFTVGSNGFENWYSGKSQYTICYLSENSNGFSFVLVSLRKEQHKDPIQNIFSKLKSNL